MQRCSRFFLACLPSPVICGQTGHYHVRWYARLLKGMRGNRRPMDREGSEQCVIESMCGMRSPYPTGIDHVRAVRGKESQGSDIQQYTQRPTAESSICQKEWRELRPVIMSVYEYVDIYALYVEHQLITLKDSDPIHHIIELEEDWEQRLNPLNLIPLEPSDTQHNHSTI